MTAFNWENEIQVQKGMFYFAEFVNEISMAIVTLKYDNIEALKVQTKQKCVSEKDG